MDPEERRFFYALMLAACIIAVILVVFTRTLLKKHRKHLAVYKDKVLTEISILEMERKRIAHDLHDDLGPLLSSIKLQMNCLNYADEEDAETIDRCTTLIGDAIQKIRETSNNLTSETLSRKGLLQAIREFSAVINKTKQLEVEIDISMRETHLSKSSELHLYRIFQEVLTNCIKHSRATTFTLRIVQENDQMIVTLHDNGTGFDMENISENLGFGLKNIANRVEILNGLLFLDAQIDRGVLYTIEIPLTVRTSEFVKYGKENLSTDRG